MWFTFWDISESAAFAWSIKSLLFRCEAASPISISTACLRKTFLRIQPHDIFFRMFTSNTSLTSEYCKQAQCPGMPKLRWSTGVAEFWSGEWNLKVQDMKRDENQSDNLRHLKTVCLDGLPLNRLLLCCCWGLPSQRSHPGTPKTRQTTCSQKTDFLFHCAMFVSWYDALLTRSPRNLTHVKTYGVFCLLFQCSKIRIKDLCRWSYVKLFGLYMHHDSEVSSHGSRGRRILDSSIMVKNLQKRRKKEKCK